MELTSKDVRLRDLLYDDREQLAFLANDIKIGKNLRDMFPHPYTFEDAEKFIDMVKSHDPTHSFAIEYRHELAGVISLIPQQDVYRKSAEIGYWIGVPFWGKGIATEAVRLITQYGFESLKLERIFAGVFEGNVGSSRVLEKNGYHLEGIFRKAVFKGSKFLDERRFAKLSKE